MTKSVRYVRRNEALSAAAKIMWDCDCGTVPVLEETGERVVGMITDRDICMATWSRDAAPSSIPVSNAMSKDLYYCSSSDDITTAETLMRSQQIRRLPILDSSKRLVGILSLADVARRTARPGARGADADIRPDELALMLADISQPPGSAARISAQAGEARPR
jgi:CBS domain-containing protein